jgi:hypothetical protein
VIILRAIAVLVGLTGLQHGVQAVLGLHAGGEPLALTLQHVIVSLTSIAAAYALWRRIQWAPWMLAVAGATTAMLVASLGPLLQMGAAERGGLWTGAASIALLTAVAVWYARRVVGRFTGSAAATRTAVSE